MKILITGALGHIGSRLIHSIKPGEFEEIILLDNLLTQRYSSLFDLPSGVSFRFIEADICKADLAELFDGIDAVVHLAAITDAAGSFDNQEAIENVNFTGTETVAQACLQKGCRLFFPSSTSVYTSKASVVNENSDASLGQAQSPYAASKIRGEDLLKEYGNKGLKYTVCRFGTIFGISKGMRFHTAVNKFCWQAVFNKPITVWETALGQKRPYLDLGDAVEIIKFILIKDLFDNEINNAATVNCTVQEIIDVIASHVNGINISKIKATIMNDLSYSASNDRLISKGFCFKGDLQKSVAETVSLLKNASAKRNQ